MKKNNSVKQRQRNQQVRGPELTELMVDSEIKGGEYRKKNNGQDVLSQKVHHPASKQENPVKDIYDEQDND